MYTQGLDSLGKDCLQTPSADAAALTAHFEAKVARDEKIEPKDWMPDAYRQHARAADLAARALGDRRHAARGQLDHARADAAPQGRAASPRCRTRAATACICTAPRKPWASRATSWSSSCSPARAKYSSIFNYPTLTWADIGAIGWLVDGAAIMNQIPICRCSYGPYARAMVRICSEESFHQRQGFEIMMTLARGTAAQQRDGAGCARTAGGGRRS